jgi:tagatose-1,6-bisphosphate aldolase non-catalytic subunit AgaZ/GatZ
LRSSHRQLSANWKHALDQSALYRMLLRTHRPVNEQDVALYGGIVGAAKSLIETRYPESQFHVILWDYDEFRQDAERILQTFAHHRVPVTPISQILPDFPADHARYEIHPDDRHPNALAHALIAEFVAQRLVNSSADESSH